MNRRTGRPDGLRARDRDETAPLTNRRPVRFAMMYKGHLEVGTRPAHLWPENRRWRLRWRLRRLFDETTRTFAPR